MLRKPTISRILDLEIILHNFLVTDEKTAATTWLIRDRAELFPKPFLQDPAQCPFL